MSDQKTHAVRFNHDDGRTARTRCGIDVNIVMTTSRADATCKTCTRQTARERRGADS